MATIKDVAREAGVAVGTVSRYLNGAEIKEANRKKIDDAVHRLHFRLNPIARGLKTSRTNTIGVIIPDLSDPYSTTIVRSIEQKLYECGYNMFTCDSWGNPELERQKVELLMQQRVDGLILYPCAEDISYMEQYNDRDIPVVTVDIRVKGFACDQVVTDNINATYQAVEWLIANNHKRIAIICGKDDYFTSAERLKGYTRVLEDYSIPVESDLVKDLGYDEPSGHEAMVQLMKLANPPTAVIACNY
jgi:LacI family transcriptional regulator